MSSFSQAGLLTDTAVLSSLVEVGDSSPTDDASVIQLWGMGTWPDVDKITF